MTDHEIDTLLTLANPLDEQALQALDLGDAELGLCDALLAESPPARALAAVPAPRERRRRPRRRLLAGFALAALAAFAFVALSDDDPGESGTAWAAPLVRLAESSPLLLVDDPQWRVVRADETDRVEGEMTFVRGDEPVDLNAVGYRTRAAELNWRRGSLAEWQRDRAHDAALVVRRTLLGHPAQVSQYQEYRGIRDFTAIWAEDHRVLEFRAIAADLAAFERLAGSLKRVSVDAWLSAMPASVVKAANRPAAVHEMLADIPLPPGFDAAGLERDAVLKDRYQLGAQVTGAVACAWIDRWDAARRRGDDATAKQAIAAMQTAHGWKILEQMKADGAWTEVLLGYADAMRGDGLWAGRPLKGDVRSGLGCGSR
jgi:hypothetical protein